MTRATSNRHLVAILCDIADGNSSAMRGLYEATASDLYALCFAVVRNREAAQDVLQEVYTKVWNRAEGFDPEAGSPIIWLRSIARNSAIDRVRAQGRRPTVSDISLDSIADDAELPDERLIREEGTEHLIRQVDQLSDPEQTFIRNAYLRGLTYSQVAAEAGVPLGTVKTRIRRGLKVLRAQVKRD